MYCGADGFGSILAAQASDEHPQMLGLIDRVRPPDRLENGAMREHPSGILRQKAEELELLWRQAHFLAVDQTRKRSRSMTIGPRHESVRSTPACRSAEGRHVSVASSSSVPNGLVT